MTYKLYYFNIRGLGEPIRYLLKYGKVDFEDIRFEREDWPKHKDSMPMKQMPVLEIDGKKYFQSVAIARYLGTKFGLAGKNEEENLNIDIAIDTFVDLRMKVSAAFQVPEEQKVEAMKKLKEEVFPLFLTKLNEVAEGNDGHMACKRLTWADFYVAALSGVLTFVNQGVNPYDQYPSLKKVVDNVESIESIKKWISERPVTDL